MSDIPRLTTPKAPRLHFEPKWRRCLCLAGLLSQGNVDFVSVIRFMLCCIPVLFVLRSFELFRASLFFSSSLQVRSWLTQMAEDFEFAVAVESVPVSEKEVAQELRSSLNIPESHP